MFTCFFFYVITDVQVTSEPGAAATPSSRRTSLNLNSNESAETEIELTHYTNYVEDDSSLEMLYHEAAIFLEVNDARKSFTQIVIFSVKF
jgi:hypothetical protein